MRTAPWPSRLRMQYLYRLKYWSAVADSVFIPGVGAGHMWFIAGQPILYA
jgi:hypothetical protein